MRLSFVCILTVLTFGPEDTSHDLPDKMSSIDHVNGKLLRM